MRPDAFLASSSSSSSPATSPSPPARRLDRTTLIVRLGLVVLTVTGLLTIWGEPLLLGPGADLGTSASPSEPAAAPTPTR